MSGQTQTHPQTHSISAIAHFFPATRAHWCWFRISARYVRYHIVPLCARSPRWLRAIVRLLWRWERACIRSPLLRITRAAANRGHRCKTAYTHKPPALDSRKSTAQRYCAAHTQIYGGNEMIYQCKRVFKLYASGMHACMLFARAQFIMIETRANAHAFMFVYSLYMADERLLLVQQQIGNSLRATLAQAAAVAALFMNRT